jgi:hypothetical protein
LLAGCGTFHEDEAVPLSAVPSVVQSTIQANANGGTVMRVEKETKHGDHVVYEAKVKGKDGERSEIEVAESGKLLKYKLCDEKGEHHEGKGHRDGDNDNGDNGSK